MNRFHFQILSLSLFFLSLSYLSHFLINQHQNRTQLPPLLLTPPTKPFTQPQKNNNIKHISPSEMQVKREKGLCYFCDDKFSFSHKCSNKQVLMLQVVDDEDTHSEPEPPDQTQANNDHVFMEHHLSLKML